MSSLRGADSWTSLVESEEEIDLDFQRFTNGMLAVRATRRGRSTSWRCVGSAEEGKHLSTAVSLLPVVLSSTHDDTLFALQFEFLSPVTLWDNYDVDRIAFRVADENDAIRGFESLNQALVSDAAFLFGDHSDDQLALFMRTDTMFKEMVRLLGSNAANEGHSRLRKQAIQDHAAFSRLVQRTRQILSEI